MVDVRPGFSLNRWYVNLESPPTAWCDGDLAGVDTFDHSLGSPATGTWPPSASTSGWVRRPPPASPPRTTNTTTDTDTDADLASRVPGMTENGEVAAQQLVT
ncbi:hypothetical protein KRM28CT15_45590 [Krasilnikovia sp. M28-CT-15]